MTDTMSPPDDATEVEETSPVDASERERDIEHGVPASRVCFALLFPVLGAAVMAGGVFTGPTARIYAAVAGILGMGIAYLAAKMKSGILVNLVIVVGIFAIGLVLLGPGDFTRAGELASQAAREADLTRPPIDFTAGWKAISGWLMGIVGFATVWVGIGIEKRSLALLVPLPFAAIAGISVPDDQQTISGIVVLVLFAIGLGVLSSINSFEGGDRPPLAYELRKLAKSIPVIGVITVALIALAQTSFLFPDPQIDPATEPQTPDTKPLSEVEDRVLFEVGPDIERGDTELVVTGPWRMGTLPIYDGKDWRLPAVDDNQFEEVPDDGIIDQSQIGRLGARARFKVLGLGGTTLPGLPLSAAIQSAGAPLTYDATTGNVRVASGEVRSGQVYVIASARLPSVDDLRLLGNRLDLGPQLRALTEIPDPPPAVQALLDEADAEYDNLWDKFDFLRTHVLDTVVATGPGTPVGITPERVQEILGSPSPEASPFEIVAMQAMLARWIELPSRIGFGYDKGDLNGATFEVRPRHGASFVEVNFTGYGWLPVLGDPKQAKPTVGTDPDLQQTSPDILPSNETAVELYLPSLVPPPSTLTKQIQLGVLIAAGVLALLGLIWLLFPIFHKSVVRSRRRAAARRAGPRARIALAYAEWRDHAADHGFSYPTDTPIMFLNRFVEDAEHTELAWLTTRCLWGDLRDDADDVTAGAAEELSRALRGRLSSAQSASMRFVAGVSRVSLRDPFAPATDLTGGRRNGASRRRRRDEEPDEGPPDATRELEVDPVDPDRIEQEVDRRVPAPI